tara:strand:+ start:582 stop:1466 length:885 start_codon:yes stop_codon:yes gene_type:complete
MHNSTKGIVLAGGSGTRLHPITQVISKQLLPIYDKPMIYFSVSLLMLAEIRDILIISTPNDIDNYKKILGTGEDIGVNFSYCIQDNPDGLASAFILGEDFIGNSNVALVLGDNIFYGDSLSTKLIRVREKSNGATIFGYHVNDPERFGVVEFDDNGKAISIEEKPKNPKSKYAVTGLYFYDNKVINYAKKLTPSKRGELEITDINNIYLNNNELEVEILNRGFVWLDTGTFDSLLEAGKFVEIIEKRQGKKIACLQEISFLNGWITLEELRLESMKHKKTSLGNYLKSIYDQMT